MTSVNDLDSSILCEELARRMCEGLWNLDSVLFHSHQYTTHFSSYTYGDGRKLKPGMTKIRQWLMFEVSNTTLIRCIEGRYFSGNSYCQREFRRAMSPFSEIPRHLTPIDRWNRCRNR